MHQSSSDAEADLSFGGFSLSVHGREFPDHDDYWDGNWLTATASMKTYGSFVEVSGPILHLSDVQLFRDALLKLSETLTGTAKLEGFEPNLRLTFEGSHTGHADVQVEITPDHMLENHRFNVSLDQTSYAPIIRGCNDILRRFPIRGSPGDV